MDLLKYIKNLNLKMLMLALVHFDITLLGDMKIFVVEYNPYYYFVKLLVLIFLISLYQYLPNLQKDIKKRKTFFKFFAIYFGINFALLLLTWPGTWVGGDSLSIYYGAVHLGVEHWFHALTGLFFVFSLALIPFPVGIVIMQILTVSLIAGYMLDRFHKLYPTVTAYHWLLLPMCLPMVLVNNLMPSRYPLYAYVLLFLFLNIIFKYLDKTQLTTKDMITWGIFGAIAVAWRPEGIVYLPGIPLMLGILFRKKLNWKKTGLFLAIFLSSCTIIEHINETSFDYKLGGCSNNLHNILAIDFKTDNKEQDLNIINNVINIDKFMSTEDTGLGVGLSINKNADNTQIKQFERTFAKLMFYNFPYIAKKQLLLLQETCDARIFNYITNIYTHKEDNIEVYLLPEIINFRNRSFNSELRMRVIWMLGTNFTYDLRPVLLFLPMLFIIGIAERNKLLLIISGLLIAHTCLLTLFLPHVMATYYMTIYLCTYVFTTMFLLKSYYGKK